MGFVEERNYSHTFYATFYARLHNDDSTQKTLHHKPHFPETSIKEVSPF